METDLKRHIYQFRFLEPPFQIKIIRQLESAAPGAIQWPPSREKYIVPLCKEIGGLPLNLDEKLLLGDIRRKFGAMAQNDVLDLCLLFWQISGEFQYRELIRSIAQNGLSPLKHQAQVIVEHYGL